LNVKMTAKSHGAKTGHHPDWHFRNLLLVTTLATYWRLI
jgi:hypothetical protein